MLVIIRYEDGRDNILSNVQAVSFDNDAVELLFTDEDGPYGLTETFTDIIQVAVHSSDGTIVYERTCE